MDPYSIVRINNNGTLTYQRRINHRHDQHKSHHAKSYISHGGVCNDLSSASNNAEWNQQIMTVKEEFMTPSLNNITDC